MARMQEFRRAKREDSGRGSLPWAASMEAKGTTGREGVEGSFPALLLATGALGFVLPRRRPSGRYEASWLRLVPMAATVALFSWIIITFPIGFTEVAYDKVVDLIPHSTNTVLILYSFAMAIYRRRETANLFKALDGKLKPSNVYFSVLSSFLFLLHGLLFFAINCLMTDWEKKTLIYVVSLTFMHPTLPLLLDLYVAHLIRGLNQVYQGALEGVADGDAPPPHSHKGLGTSQESRVFVVSQVRDSLPFP